MADFSWEAIKAGLEIIKHSQVAATLLVGGGMSAATWYLTKRSYDKGDFRTRIEVIGFEPELQPDGTYLVDFPTHGDQMNLSQVIGLPRLEKKIVAATRRTIDGYLILDDPRSHKLMMGILEDHVTGNDARTNAEALAGVPTRRVEIIFAPMYRFEQAEDVSMIRVFEISRTFADMLSDPKQSTKFSARLPRKKDMLDWAIDIAQKMDDPMQSSSDTAYIWSTTLKASFGAMQPSSERRAA